MCPKTKAVTHMDKILLVVTSYNRPLAFENCLKSLRKMAGHIDVLIIDDHSPKPEIAEIAAKSGYEFILGPGGKGRHGGLYQNLQLGYETAIARGYDYMATVQDDMQMVRPFDAAILTEYAGVFARDPDIAMIDNRFSRSGFKATYSSEIGAYLYENSYTYSDVGFFNLPRLQAKNWSFVQFEHQFVAGEKFLKQHAAEKKFKKVAAFTPVVMHVPLPQLIRNNIRIPRFSRLFRQLYTYDDMTPADIARMDNRDPSTPPNFREFLRFSNINAFDRWMLSGKQDSKIF